MKNAIIDPNESAFPSDYQDFLGLTKREYFAAMFVQGLVSDPLTIDKIAKLALQENMEKDAAISRLGVDLADALIAELNKPGQTPG